MNQIKIRLFATLKDKAGQPKIQVDIELPTTVADLMVAIQKQYPQLTPSLATALISVNQAFAVAETAVSASDEVAIFPPVSGGEAAPFPYPTYFAISEADIDIHAIQSHLRQPDVGAIVTFTGSVRGQTKREGLPATTFYLEYEAYEEMATLKMAQIAREIWKKWSLVKGIAIVQRVGRLNVGEVTTFIACAAGHRDQGVFEAALYGIDRLKEIVPVWKKEVSAQRTAWVEGHYHATDKDNV